MPRKPAVVQEWTFKEAEARFSEVFRLARSKGPQRISRRSGAVVVIPAEEFDRLGSAHKPEETLGEFLARSPLMGSGVEFTRDKDVGREIDL